MTGPDPRRWWTLAITLLAVAVTVIDNTVLTVAIPQIIHDLDTTVTGVQWVFTGYALTFASLLVIGGRLGDIYGPRRILIIGVTLFGIGSLIAALSTSLPMLILGEAVIEGAGAALLVPSTLSIVAHTFEGRERAIAFAAWATAIGAAAALGPVLGGYLTTYQSWRWAFGINVVIAPVVVVGSLLVTPRDSRGERQRLDLRGAALIASGMFLVVFALSQGGIYGWWTPQHDYSIGGTVVWPTSAPVSIIVVALLAGAGILTLFVRTELVLERQRRDPLFQFSQFRFLTFRYIEHRHVLPGLLTTRHLDLDRALPPGERAPLPHGERAVGAAGGPRHPGRRTIRWLDQSVPRRHQHAAPRRGRHMLRADVRGRGALAGFLLLGGAARIPGLRVQLGHGVVPDEPGAPPRHRTRAHRRGERDQHHGTTSCRRTRSRDDRHGVRIGGAEHGVHAALFPSLMVGVIALAATAAVTWRLPQIEHEHQSLAEELVDDYTLVEPMDARMET